MQIIQIVISIIDLLAVILPFIFSIIKKKKDKNINIDIDINYQKHVKNYYDNPKSTNDYSSEKNGIGYGLSVVLMLITISCFYSHLIELSILIFLMAIVYFFMLFMFEAKDLKNYIQYIIILLSFLTSYGLQLYLIIEPPKHFVTPYFISLIYLGWLIFISIFFVAKAALLLRDHYVDKLPVLSKINFNLSNIAMITTGLGIGLCLIQFSFIRSVT